MTVRELIDILMRQGPQGGKCIVQITIGDTTVDAEMGVHFYVDGRAELVGKVDGEKEEE